MFLLCYKYTIMWTENLVEEQKKFDAVIALEVYISFTLKLQNVDQVIIEGHIRHLTDMCFVVF